MQNWFNTLNDALASEHLIDTFPIGYNLGYGETIRYAKNGVFVTVYRDERGMYERPISYSTKCDDFVHITK